MRMGIITEMKAAGQVLLEAQKVPEYQKLLSAMAEAVEMQEELAQAKADLRAARQEIADLKGR